MTYFDPDPWHYYDKITAQLERLTRADGKGFKHARCPAHEDDNPSLSLFISEKGDLMVKCWAGCPKPSIARALGVPWPLGFCKPREGFTVAPALRLEDVFVYAGAGGSPVLRVLRYGNREGGKTFKQQQYDGRGGWHYGAPPDEQRVLFRSDRLSKRDPSRPVFLVEGERKVFALERLGFCATCVAGGAKAPWLPQYGKMLAGSPVVVWPDNDAPGREYAARVAWPLLVGGVGSVRVLDVPGLPEKGDVLDWLKLHPRVPPEELRRHVLALARSAPAFGVLRSPVMIGEASRN